MSTSTRLPDIDIELLVGYKAREGHASFAFDHPDIIGTLLQDSLDLTDSWRFGYINAYDLMVINPRHPQIRQVFRNLEAKASEFFGWHCQGYIS